jgi:hypothetical protein
MTEVIEISPTSRYAVVIPGRVSPSELDRLWMQLDAWWKSDSKFIVLDRGVELVRLDGNDEALSTD